MTIAHMSIQLLAHTQARDTGDMHPDMRHELGVTDMDEVAEFAGRSCYESWDRPNPATRANADYLAHINEVGHFSVLEHASATFYIRGVSRTLTHELVRHRHLSPSQRSQRYVDEGDALLVMPADLRLSQRLSERLEQHHDDSLMLYRQAVKELTEIHHLSRKDARGAARAFLLNATETRLVMSGNMRAWRDFLNKRWHVAAEKEIRTLAGLILTALRDVSPHAVADIPGTPRLG